jgi:hypothetical protein
LAIDLPNRHGHSNTSTRLEAPTFIDAIYRSHRKQSFEAMEANT